MSYSVGDRVKFVGLNIEERRAIGAGEGGGAWDLLHVGSFGTVDETAGPEYPERLFVIFDEVEMPLASQARMLGQSTGWPILDTEVEALVTADAA